MTGDILVVVLLELGWTLSGRAGWGGNEGGGEGETCNSATSFPPLE